MIENIHVPVNDIIIRYRGLSGSNTYPEPQYGTHKIYRAAYTPSPLVGITEISGRESDLFCISPIQTKNTRRLILLSEIQTDRQPVRIIHRPEASFSLAFNFSPYIHFCRC